MVAVGKSPPGLLHNLTIKPIIYVFMLNKILTKIVVLVFIGILANTYLLAEPHTIYGAFRIGDVWYKGTLTAETITLDTCNGCVYVKGSPPYTLRDQSGSFLKGSVVDAFYSEYDESRGSGSGNHWSSNNWKITFTSDLLSVATSDVLDMEVYDITGKRIYNASEQVNISINRSSFNFRNGVYFLRLINKEGEEAITTFVLTDNYFMIKP